MLIVSCSMVSRYSRIAELGRIEISQAFHCEPCTIAHVLVAGFCGQNKIHLVYASKCVVSAPLVRMCLHALIASMAGAFRSSGSIVSSWARVLSKLISFFFVSCGGERRKSIFVRSDGARQRSLSSYRSRHLGNASRVTLQILVLHIQVLAGAQCVKVVRCEFGKFRCTRRAHHVHGCLELFVRHLEQRRKK